MKRDRRTVDGLLLVDKPAGASSNAVLQRVRRLFRANKAGHGGTLDPLASGLLPVLFGDATKFADQVLGSTKTYLATLELGVTTTTGDAEGDVLERRPVEVDRKRIDDVLAGFLGEQRQTPPMYSALKHQGRPLYELARKGVSIDRAPREIVIRSLECCAFDPPRLVLRVVCSKGTYVRVLAEDIGRVLGTGAHLAGLRREAAGELTLDSAVTPDALEGMQEGERDGWLLPLERLVRDVPRVDLSGPASIDFQHGKVLSIEGLAAGRRAVFGPGPRFLGIADVIEPGRLVPRRLLAQRSAGAAQAAEIS